MQNVPCVFDFSYVIVFPMFLYLLKQLLKGIALLVKLLNVFIN